MPGEDKTVWRARQLAARRELLARQGPEGRATQAERIAAHALAWLRGHASPGDLRGCTVTAYEQLRTEPPTDALIAALQEAGVRVLVPVTLAGGALDWRAVGTGTGTGTGTVLGPGTLAQVDVAFLPGLAVDDAGIRLGRGGGYYDRALPLLRPGVPTITVLHDHERVAGPAPHEPHDVPVWGVLTAADGVRRVSRPPRGPG